MRIKWLRIAERNLDAIGEFIAEDNPEAAERTIRRIVEAIDLLRDRPALGRAGRVPGTRELVIPDTPFIVPYRIRNGILEILRVLHGARNWPQSF
ncbi:MAG: type II toxin-antitoxin system RelE/ParE family toxin [Terriglobales bacterium]